MHLNNTEIPYSAAHNSTAQLLYTTELYITALNGYIATQDNAKLHHTFTLPNSSLHNLA